MTTKGASRCSSLRRENEMSIAEIVELVGLAIAIIVAIVSIIGSIRKGQAREFIIAKMEEAEQMFEGDPDKAKKKLAYVIEKTKEEFKLAALFMNIEKFVERIIAATKKINFK